MRAVVVGFSFGWTDLGGSMDTCHGVECLRLHLTMRGCGSWEHRLSIPRAAKGTKALCSLTDIWYGRGASPPAPRERHYVRLAMRECG